jgi:hypothetical protein
MLLWVMLNCILVKTLTSGEVITLIKDHSVTCVVTQNSVIYISSGVPEVKRELRELSNWIYSDWDEIHSRNSFHAPVTDKRWQNFTTTIRDGFIIKSTQCFSTYSDNNNINLTLTSKDKTIQRTITLGQDDNNVEKKNFPFRWFHYAILAKNNNLKILIDNITENIKIDFVPDAVVIHNNNLNNLKFHNCKNLFIMFVVVNVHIFIDLENYYHHKTIARFDAV